MGRNPEEKESLGLRSPGSSSITNATREEEEEECRVTLELLVNAEDRSVRLTVMWGGTSGALGPSSFSPHAGTGAGEGSPSPSPGAREHYQQSPSVAMTTSISLLPISSKALAKVLRSPSSWCSASHKSRITPVGLALVAK